MDHDEWACKFGLSTTTVFTSFGGVSRCPSLYTTQKKLGYYQHLKPARFLSSFDLRFEPAAICFTCFIRFHIHKLNFDKLSLMKTTSWKLKFILLKILICASTHSYKHINHVYYIRYINKETSVVAYRLGWNALLFTKRLHIVNNIIGYS